jgi:hypothetical protein
LRKRSAEAGREVHLHEGSAAAAVAELSVVGDVRPVREQEPRDGVHDAGAFGMGQGLQARPVVHGVSVSIR